MRIERLFHASHERDRFGRQLQAEIRRLREADPVFAGDRSFERDDALEQRPLGVVGALQARQVVLGAP